MINFKELFEQYPVDDISTMAKEYFRIAEESLADMIRCNPKLYEYKFNIHKPDTLSMDKFIKIYHIIFANIATSPTLVKVSLTTSTKIRNPVTKQDVYSSPATLTFCVTRP